MDRITLEELIKNEPRELEVPDVGTVLVRDPTEEDRIEARKLAKKHPLWEELDPTQKDNLELSLLVLRIVVDPKIPPDQMYKCSSVKLGAIIDVVAAEITGRTRRLADKRRPMVDAFLGRKRREKQ